MSIENHYIINERFMYMRGHRDRHGNLCTEVRETGRTIIINKSPLEVLDYSIKAIGFDLRGALETSKWLLEQNHMCPIMVNPIHRIVLFPTKSHYHDDNIWFRPYHIKRTSNINGKTMILFSNSTTLILPTRLASFNHKLQTAEQLKSMTIRSAGKPFTFVLKPKKKRSLFLKNVKKKDKNR